MAFVPSSLGTLEKSAGKIRQTAERTSQDIGCKVLSTLLKLTREVKMTARQ